MEQFHKLGKILITKTSTQMHLETMIQSTLWRLERRFKSVVLLFRFVSRNWFYQYLCVYFRSKCWASLLCWMRARQTGSWLQLMWRIQWLSTSMTSMTLNLCSQDCWPRHLSGSVSTRWSFKSNISNIIEKFILGSRWKACQFVRFQRRVQESRICSQYHRRNSQLLEDIDSGGKSKVEYVSFFDHLFGF